MTQLFFAGDSFATQNHCSLNETYMLKHLLLLSITATSFAAKAQSILEYGDQLYRNPSDKRPLFYYDLLRNQQPYFVWQDREDITKNNWRRQSKFITEKTDTLFSKLEVYSWDSTAKNWTVENRYQYNYQGTNNKITVRQSQSQVFAAPSPMMVNDSVFYDGNGLMSAIIVTRMQPNPSQLSRRYFLYDGSNRVIKDSTLYTNTATKVISYFNYSGNEVEGITLFDGDTVQRKTVLNDMQGRPVKSYDYSYSNNVVSSVSRETFSYDANGKVSLYEFYFAQSADTTQLMPAEKIEHYYRTDGQLDYWVRSLSDLGTPWDIDYKLQIQYTGAGKADTGFSYGHDAGIYEAAPFALFIFDPAATTIKNLAAQQGAAVYPNPATNVLHTGRKNTLIRISNMEGQTLMNNISIDGSIDISKLPAGLYNLRIGNEQAQRFLKL